MTRRTANWLESTVFLQAIGAAARLMGPEGSGPLVEWQAGVGLGSQDGAVKVLASPRPATHLWVRWPGGAVQEIELPDGRLTGEISVTMTPVSVEQASRQAVKP